MMVRNVFCALLAGALLISGFAYAEQSRKTNVGEEAIVEVDGLKMIKTVDETWGSRNGEVSLLDAHSGGQAYRGSKAAVYDTLRYLTTEGKTWTDTEVAADWDRVDFTAQQILWQVADTMKKGLGGPVTACNGDSAWWCGDPDVLGGGYIDDMYQTLTTTNAIVLPAADSIYLTYNQWLRCEEYQRFPPPGYSWDGYQVRLSTDNPTFADTTFMEIKPWHGDGSYYATPRYRYHEWDSLWAWGYHGETGGGFSQDTSTACSPKVFNLSGYASETVKVRYVFATDGAFNTLNDTTFFGLVLDDITVTSYVAGVPTELFKEDCESLPHKMTPGIPAATGDYWWLATAQPYAGIYYGADGDTFSGVYLPDMDNGLVMPPIARTELDTNTAELLLRYYWRGYADDPQADVNQSDWVSNDYSLDGVLWEGISRLVGDTWFVYQPNNNANWSEMASLDMTNLSALLDTTQYDWDTLWVRVLFHSDEDPVGPQGRSFKIDNVAIIRRIGFPWDIGVSAAKIPGPNANDEQLFMSDVTIENYGFNTAQSGKYFLKMAIKDSNGTVIWGPTQIADPGGPPPDVPSLATRIIPLDPTAANFTLTQEGSYDFLLWTEFTDTTDGDPGNDTLRIEYTLSKAFAYPGAYNYPAGQGQIRYHDQGFYSPTSVWRILMDSSEVAAVHFDPPDEYDPFDVALAFWPFYYDEVSRTYNFHVYDSGSLPGAVLHTEQLVTWAETAPGSIHTVRIDLDTVAALQHRSTDFWLGLEFPPGGDDLGMSCEPNDPINAIQATEWGHSFFWNDTSGSGDWIWQKADGSDDANVRWDYLFTTVIKWRTIDPEVFAESDPSKNDSGNVYLNWDDVTQASKYAIYRETEAYPESVSFYDETLVSSYSDVDAAGDVNTHYYYWFHTVHQDASIYDKLSRAVGEFDRQASD